MELADGMLAAGALGGRPGAAVQAEFFDGGASGQVLDDGGAAFVLDLVFHLWVGLTFFGGMMMMVVVRGDSGYLVYLIWSLR
jgi:hypothetical protein